MGFDLGGALCWWHTTIGWKGVVGGGGGWELVKAAGCGSGAHCGVHPVSVVDVTVFLPVNEVYFPRQLVPALALVRLVHSVFHANLKRFRARM